MIKLATSVRNARLQAIADAMSAGAGQGTLTLYAGDLPAQNGGTPPGQALVTIDLPDPLVESLDGGILTLATFPEAMATVEGLATWGRIQDGDGAWVMDVDVGEEGSGATIVISTTYLYAGVLVGIDTAVFAEP